MFIKRFPRIVERGFGPDWEYVGWFSWMLHETFPGSLPVAQGEYVDVPPGGLVSVGLREGRLTAPPLYRIR
jgi:hypothetical protein